MWDNPTFSYAIHPHNDKTERGMETMKKYTLHDVAKFADAFGMDFFTHFDIVDAKRNPYAYREIGSADGYIMPEDLHDDIMEEMYEKQIIVTSDDVVVSFLEEKMLNGCHDILEVSWFFSLDEHLKDYIIVKVDSYAGKQMLTVKHISEVEA